MATTTPTEGDNQDNYELELNRVREKVKTKFAELADCLKARENQLLIELDNILASYLSFQTELEEVNEEKRNLETTKTRLQIQLESPTNISIRNGLVLSVYSHVQLKSYSTLSVTAEKLFDTIKSCIHDVEDCGLFVEIISTDNYPLNVKLFKLFSPNRKLETRVPHPCDIRRGLFLTFDFVHILKTSQ